MNNKYQIILIALMAILSFSCSNSSNPINPNIEPVVQPSVGEYEISDQTFTDSEGVFGAWQVLIDTENLTSEIIPARNTSAIGDYYDADLSQFLTVSPCSNCLQITNLYLDSYGDLNLAVRMKHPFSNGAARPDLHGFDVRAIFIFTPYNPDEYSEIKVSVPTGPQENALTHDYYYGVLNADGYTNHFDNIVSDPRYFMGGSDVEGNLNPFLRFFEDYSIPAFDPMAPVGQNVMKTGSGTYTRTAVISKTVLEREILELYIVADVAYGQSAVLANRMNPQYYLPAFHRTEPWKVEYWIENNTLAGPVGTSADIVVQVSDWQQGYSVDPAYPNPANLSGLRESSNVSQVELFVPSYLNSPVISSVTEGGTGTPSDPLQYRLHLVKEKTNQYSAIGLLAIRDELNGQAAPSGRSPIPVSPAGFPYETTDIIDYSLYLPIYIPIADPGIGTDRTKYIIDEEMGVPIEDLYVSYEEIDLYPIFYMDPSHKKFQYRWDYDYDGVTFDIDGSGLPLEDGILTHEGRNDVGLRVRTNSVPPQEYIYTIPVYLKGTQFQNTLQNPSPTSDSTDIMRGHSVAITEDYVYCVFLHEVGGQRDVWLSVGDHDGNFQNYNITNSANVNYEPSILVRSWGSGTGVYIFYGVQVNNNHLYMTKGDFDGTNFSAPIRINSAIVAEQRYPVPVNMSDRICVYFSQHSGAGWDICVSYTDNWAASWSYLPNIVPVGAHLQYKPSADADDSTVYLFWEDYKDFLSRGSDIYWAKSTDGIAFTEIDNFTPTTGLIWETEPSVRYGHRQLGIGYISQPNTASYSEPRVVHYNVVNDSLLTYTPSLGAEANKFVRSISVSPAGPGRILAAYCSIDNTSLIEEQVLVELDMSDWIGSFSERKIYKESIGTVTSAGVRSNPGIACNNPLGLGVATETFMAWTTYNSGIFQSPTLPTVWFGQVDRAIFVTGRDGY